MAIVLEILKIIGIVILALLALLIVIALLVLFVPIRYKVTGEIAETNLSTEASLLPERIHVKAGFSWLLHFISGGIDYPDSKEFTVKMLCFKIFPFKEKNDSEEGAEEDKPKLPNEMEEGFEDKKDKDKSDEKEESGSSDIDKDAKEDSKSDGSNDGDETSAESGKEGETQENTDKTDDSEDSENADNTADSDDFEDEEKESFFDFLGKIFKTIGDIIRVPQNVLEKLQCTISSICAKIDLIKNTLNNDIFKRAFAVTKKQVIRVLKMVLPRKFRINIKLGMEDPTVTADIFAAYGFLYPILAGKVFIEPSFERPVLEGTIYIKGKIRLFKVAWAAAILFFNKDVRKTFRRFKKILKS